MVTEFSELIKKKSLPPYTNNSRIRQKFRQISHLTLPPPLPLPIHYSRRSNRGAKHGARVRRKKECGRGGGNAQFVTERGGAERDGGGHGSHLNAEKHLTEIAEWWGAGPSIPSGQRR